MRHATSASTSVPLHHGTNDKEERKENDATMKGLKRLGSITTLTGPFNQITSKFRRPSTAAISSKEAVVVQNYPKNSAIPRPKQVQPAATHGKSKINPELTTPAGASSLNSATVLNQQANLLMKSQTISSFPTLSHCEEIYTRLPQSHSSTCLDHDEEVKTRNYAAYTMDGGAHDKNAAKQSLEQSIKPGLTSMRISSQPHLMRATGSKTAFMVRRPSGFVGHNLASVNEEAVDKSYDSIAPRIEVETPPRWARGESFPRNPTRLPRAGTMVDLNSPSWTTTPRKPAAKALPRRSTEDEHSEMLQQSPSVRRTVPGKSVERHERYVPVKGSTRRSFDQEITINSLLHPVNPPTPTQALNGLNKAKPPAWVSETSVRQVSSRQPAPYWAGRYVSLSDRLANELIEGSSQSKSMFQHPNRYDTAGVAAALDGEAHAKRIFELLHGTCVTREAAESLAQYVLHHAEVYHLPSLACYAPKILNTFTESKAKADQTPKNRCFVRQTSTNGAAKTTGTAMPQSIRRELSRESDMTNSTLPSRETPRSSIGSSHAKKERFLDKLMRGRRPSAQKTNNGADAGDMS